MKLKQSSLLNFFYLLYLIFCLTVNGSYSAQLKQKKAEILENNFLSMKTVLKNSTFTFTTGESNYYAYGPCSKANCDLPYGTCSNENTCICQMGYAQSPNRNVTSNEPSCDYKLKSQACFFLLEVIFWVGIGHFYTGRILYGLLKLIFISVVILLDCLFKYKFYKKFVHKTQKKLNVILYFLYFTILLWQTLDIILIGLNRFKDGKGFNIRTWDSYNNNYPK
jgi:hypothetical protein